ncbi:alpha/beta hydrolase [Serpentinicella sp. ANB-PHB4]|uniref:intracellular short-chain-length polyhydroxyalkanoate depolymerase n=1 Tax=Serpentinicella sp. ANB-PHB4 TaxID=3074076 RepID=UPI0028662C8A|nr:alpha/beta hydrolase [Serpentinicella sp. ANB-PHB4]MDR5659175.1 alpha/beta hydrolase [Serpentinicella sp. ANB-PHB4]
MSTSIALKKIQLSNDETLAYRERTGGEKILVLVHGNMNSSIHWDLLIENLPSEYKVYAIDMRGFGDSTYNTPADDIKTYAEDLKLFADALDLNSFALAGWSLGGAVCMQFAATYPGYVDKLVLLASGNIKGYTAYKKNFLKKPKIGQYITSKEDIYKDIKMLIKALNKRRKWIVKKVADFTLYNLNKPTEEHYDAYIDAMFKQRNLIDVNYALIHFNISHEHNGVEPGTGEVDQITAPTLVLQGDKDVVVKVEVAKDIVSGIGDNAQLHILEGCSHNPLVDDLDKVIKAFTDFI